MKDSNEKKLFELKHDVEDLKEAIEELWKYLTEFNKQFNELKMKMEEREPDEEFDSRLVNVVHVFLASSCCFR